MRPELAAPELVLLLERHIEIQTGRQVRDLSVTLLAEGIILVSGRVTKYHVKQILLSTAMEFLKEKRITASFDVGVAD